MQEVISRLKLQTRSTLPQFDPHLSTWFLLDRVRGNKTLTEFYQGSNTGVIASIEYLLQNTEYTYLLEVSPLLIKLNHIHLSDALYQHIQEERSGIFIQSKDDNILPHLQYLFIMESDEQGQVYARYYDPQFWTTLQLSLPASEEVIWGSIDKVYTITPYSRIDKINYYTWSRPDNAQIINSSHPIHLTTNFYETNEIVQLLYFIQESAFLESMEITDEQLPNALLNLKELVKNGIQQGRHLQKLLKQCVLDKNFNTNPTVQKILQTDIAEFEKTQQLLALA